MCQFNSKRPIRLKEDLKVYKIVNPTLLLDCEEDHMEYRSYYQDFLYERGKIYRKNPLFIMLRWIFSVVASRFSILSGREMYGEGFHSYMDLSLTPFGYSMAVECTIPAGSLVSYGEHRYSEIKTCVSSAIRIDGPINKKQMSNKIEIE